MSKVAIVVLTDTEGKEGLGRIVNAMTAAKEFKEAGDKVQVFFREQVLNGWENSPSRTTCSIPFTGI